MFGRLFSSLLMAATVAPASAFAAGAPSIAEGTVVHLNREISDVNDRVEPKTSLHQEASLEGSQQIGYLGRQAYTYVSRDLCQFRFETPPRSNLTFARDDKFVIHFPAVTDDRSKYEIEISSFATGKAVAWISCVAEQASRGANTVLFNLPLQWSRTGIYTREAITMGALEGTLAIEPDQSSIKKIDAETGR